MFVPRWRRMTLIGSAVAVAVAAAALWIVTASGAQGNLPADKATAVGSQTTPMAPGQAVTLLGPFQMRTSTPADLTLQVTSECSILTELTTVGNSQPGPTAFGQVRIWVEIDGKKVPVVPTPSTNPPQPPPPASDAQSKVTFCNRAYHRDTSGFTQDPNATIHDYIDTKTANAFNWEAVNIGNGIHTIEVKGDLTKTETNSTGGTATANAYVGNRTLIVQTTNNVQTP